MPKPSTIKVFFETNILHTKQAHLLLPAKIVDYIRDHRKIESVEIQWYIPRMVIEERQHQMNMVAEVLLPKLNDLEQIIGHNLGISSEILGDRISTKIDKSIEENGLRILELDSSKLDLSDLIQRSVRRLPPFERSGEVEKGFRDAIIANTFLQEVEISPTTPRICRLVFVTGDGRLKDYLLEKTSERNNVRLLDSLDDLKSLINAIASEITEEFLAKISDTAKKVFYDFDKKDGLYKSQKIFDQISEQYEQEIKSVEESNPTFQRIPDGVILEDQTFIDKSRQTVHWTRDVLLKFRLEEKTEFVTLAGLLGGTKGTLLGSETPKPKVVAKGFSRFVVHWQHQISTKGKISRPKVNKIEFIGHEFEDSE